MRDLKAYSSALGGELSYYRDRYGLEADAVLHLDDGRYALVEFSWAKVKLMKAQSIFLKLSGLFPSATKRRSKFHYVFPT